MKPISEITQKEISQIKGICLDIDDTLTTDGKLTAKAYDSLWALKDNGYYVVPITGRPAGWCDHFARFWPVDAVVGENGAFTFFMQEGVRKRINTPFEFTPEESFKKLEQFSDEVLKEFPYAKWASDQAYREYDLAIDICEDVQQWKKEDVDLLLAFAKKKGAHAKLSSIHVNAWFGNYDKLKGFLHWLSSGAPGLTSPSSEILNQNAWCFIGDSPNDEPLFSAFHWSVGVANLVQYQDQLKSLPRWITKAKSGEGFSEMAKLLIDRK